ncbi:MAG TPA: host attachment protein [Gammaproteobacteria bacterium]|nr:host attachment protein [Gammaproteobacteria bacterium]
MNVLIQGTPVATAAMLRDAEHPRILVLVADRSRARLFRILENQDTLEEIMDLVNVDARSAERELVSDRQGRGMYHGVRGRYGRRTKFGKSGPKRHWSVDRFAADISQTLTNYTSDLPIRRIFVIANPELIGILRLHLNDLRIRVPIDEISKNITRQDIRSIRAYLPDELWPRRVAGVELV